MSIFYIYLLKSAFSYYFVFTWLQIQIWNFIFNFWSQIIDKHISSLIKMDVSESIHYLLVVDLGGTNARFRLVKRSIDDPNYRSLILEKTYRWTNYDKIDDIFTELFDNIDSISNQDIVKSKLM